MKIYYVVFPKNVAVSNIPLSRNSNSSWRYAFNCDCISFNTSEHPDEYEWFVKQATGEQSVLKEIEL